MDDIFVVENKIKEENKVVYVVRLNGKQYVVISELEDYKTINSEGEMVDIKLEHKISCLIDKHNNKKLFKKYTHGKVDTYS